MQPGPVNQKVLSPIRWFQLGSRSAMWCAQRSSPISTEHRSCQSLLRRPKLNEPGSCRFFPLTSPLNLSRSNCVRKVLAMATSAVGHAEIDPMATSHVVKSVMATSVVRVGVLIVLVVRSLKHRQNCRSVQSPSGFALCVSMSMQYWLNYPKLNAQLQKRFSLAEFLQFVQRSTSKIRRL